MFSELQQVTMADLTETDRIINAPSAPSRASSSYSTSARGGGVVNEEIQALKHKMEVADAITKRLHKKNQELVAQIERLKKETHPEASGAQPSSEAFHALSPLKREIERKDKEIRALKEMLSGGPSTASRKGAASEKLGVLAEARAKKLQEQYDELVQVKLECIAHGEATGKVNKEVKAFFTALKQKMINDALFAEVERAANCELLFEMEQRLASQQ